MSKLKTIITNFNCSRCKDRNWFIECICDDECHEIIPRCNRQGILRRFKGGHQSRGKNNGVWKGGYIKRRGYWYISKPKNIPADIDGYVGEHVYNFTQYHKCCMLPWGVVHHINRIKTDNNISNLQGMLHDVHAILHGNMTRELYKTIERTCFICGKKTYHNPDNGHNWWNEVEGKGFRCNRCYRQDPKVKQRFLEWQRSYRKKKKEKASHCGLLQQSRC